ncbi:unnamed protein product [Ceutorhynchus assimilis]|uniref:ZAD domain-containing protein n=1 Tax=Ceutorhynchus assimilis TaxID=467358 RepID=A0A9P0GM15_9CUCU|nr:unnamed protein product [Ceutorhynchus assimilis]
MASLSEMSRMCRLCLLRDNKKVKIPIFDDRDIKLFVKISALLPVKISKEDQLPKKICDGCLNKLDVLYEFRKISEDSEKTLLTWLAQVGIKDDDPTISLSGEPVTKPVETPIKEEIEEEIIDLDLAQDPSNDEFQEAEDEPDEPPAKRPRRSAAIKAQMSIAPESDDDDNGDEPDTVDVASIAKEEDENEESDYKEDNVKLENESEQSNEDLSVPGTSAYDQPGPSGLGKNEAEEPYLKKTSCQKKSVMDA